MLASPIGTASIATEIKRLNPDISIIFATTSPRSVIEAYFPGKWIHRQRSFDCGVIQSDSITMDLPGTLAKLRDIREKSAKLIASEAKWLEQLRVGLVLGDIPPMVAPIAPSKPGPGRRTAHFPAMRPGPRGALAASR